MSSSFFTKSQLIDLYSKRKLSTYDIAEKMNCDPKTAYYWLKKYNITTRPRKVVQVSKKELVSLYNSKLSLKEIGERIGCEPSAVYRKFQKYGIKTRTTWETNFIHPRHNFSKDLSEKAYLIGFRTGDLNVVKRTPLSSIIVKSNTTKIDQANLLRRMFSKYGPVWISTPESNPKMYHFTSSLNNSFSFLIKRHYSIPRWILGSKKLFLNFFAGYADAEGSIGVYNNRASFRIGSYDRAILAQIHQFLYKLKIGSRMRLETKAGIYGKLKHNGDFYRVYIRDRYAIRSCLTLLIPYLKHANRIKCAKLALQNVRSRM